MARCLPLYAAALVLLATVSAGSADSERKVRQDKLSSSSLHQKVEIKLYTRNTSDSGELLSVDDPELLQNSRFNPLVPTKVIVHGWLSGESEKRGGSLLKDALLEAGDYNVILVDWSRADSVNYVGSRLLVKSLGQLVGQLIVQLAKTGGLEYGDLHLIGHSLGAHVMGFAGRTAGLGSQGRITGLDPAGPLFWNSPSIRLDKADASFVDVIHTCGGYLGYKAAIGHADFYPNGGTWIQPGCGLDVGACSHCRSYSLLLESIETPRAFQGTKCSSWKDWKAGKCKGNATSEMGFGCSKEARGSYFLETNGKPPYSTTSGGRASDRLESSKNFKNCFDLSDHVKQHVRFHFFTNETADTKLGKQILRELNTQDILKSGYNPDLPTKVLIHGFSNKVSSTSMQVMKDAYFDREDLNILIVDWSDLDPAPLYLAGLYYVNGVGVRVAELIDFMVNKTMISLDNVHIIGHSLGAHVAAVTAENIKAGKVKRITGLDPARPFVNMKQDSGRLTPDDAVLVDVIHTNAGTLGEQPASGHIDFYPNGGKSQPGCFLDFIGTCSHGRAYELFAESISNPNAFSGAYLCDDEWDALKKRCTPNSETATMGEYLSYKTPGSYYLTTRSSSPYSSNK